MNSNELGKQSLGSESGSGIQVEVNNKPKWLQILESIALIDWTNTVELRRVDEYLNQEIAQAESLEILTAKLRQMDELLLEIGFGDRKEMNDEQSMAFHVLMGGVNAALITIQTAQRLQNPPPPTGR